MRVMAGMGRTLLVTMAALGAVACDSPTKPPPAVENVVVGPGLALIDPLSSEQFGVVVTDINGNQLRGRAVTWSAADTAVASVSPTGLVTARPNPNTSDRSTFIRAEVEGKQGQAQVLVRPSPAASVRINPFTAVLQDGQAPVLTATVRDAQNNILAGRPVIWDSRDLSTARITAAGVLTPVAFIEPANRTAVIVASIGGIVDSITVTVAPTALQAFSIYPRNPAMQLGWSKTLRVEGRTATGAVVRGLTATYSSSNPAVASVSTGGVVTSAANGSTQIIAAFGSFADTVTLTVDACGAAPAGTYPLDLRFYGPNPPTASVQAAFTCAVNRIRAIVRDPVSLTSLSGASLTNCTGEAVTLSEASSGLIIYAKVDSIDGPGQVLGRAGPCFVRSTSRLPVVGVMEFDRFDLDALEVQGRLLDVILHEMLHVIGVGTTWRDGNFSPLKWTGDVANPGFLGPRAIAACAQDHGGAGVCVDRVPIEDCVAGVPTSCGAGTRLSHWREFIFRTELMTGYISATGVQNPFSKMTIEALADLGYMVDPDQSNNYVIPPPPLQALRIGGGGSAGARELQMPEPRLPTHEIDPMGRIRPIRPLLR